MFAEFITNKNAYELCKSQPVRYDKCCIKITVKDTDLEHVKWLGFIADPNAKLTDPTTCAHNANKKAGLHNRIIERNKQVTFKKNAKTKALMARAKVKDDKETDAQMIDTEFEGF